MTKLGFFLISIALSQIATAHNLTGGEGFIAGLAHPVFGLDHFLAMLSVGILSTQIGGRAIWSVPMTFVIVMLVGGFFGMGHVFADLADHLSSWVELSIVFSVVALGLVIATPVKMPTLLAMLFVAYFAFFHGTAHGIEIPVVAKPLNYALGFILSTLLIHLAGVAIGFVLQKFKTRGKILLRFIGAIIMGMGLQMLVNLNL